MIAYRLNEIRPDRSPIGFGDAAGRWNHRGIPMIYSSSSISLVYSEILAIRGPVVASIRWNLFTFQINVEAPRVEALDLPSNWAKRPYPKSIQTFGSNWAKSKVSLVLMVPSIRIPLSAFPKESNILINPMHPDFNSHLEIIKEEEVNFELNTW